MTTASPQLHVFTTNLSSIKIPNNIHEELKVLEWRYVVYEDIQHLKRIAFKNSQFYQKKEKICRGVQVQVDF